MINKEIKRIKLVEYSNKTKNSYGIIMKEENNDRYIYKLMDVINKNLINKNNLLELIYYNIEFNETNGNLKTYIKEIMDYNEFIGKYIVNDSIMNKLMNKDDKIRYIIVIKMDLYDNTVDKIKENMSKRIDKFKTRIRNILLAIHRLHYNNLIHGDIKPNNILYNTNDEDNMILIDYGGIKHKNLKYYNKTCTITYRAPEEFIYNINTGEAGDIWSMGLLFCDMIFGKNPINEIYKINNNNAEEIIEYNFRNYFIKKKGVLIRINKNYIHMNNYYKRENDYIIFDITDKNISLNEEFVSICYLIENMLIIDYKKRIDNINYIYVILYNKNINMEIDNRIKYKNIDYSILNKRYYDERKNIYMNILDKALSNNIYEYIIKLIPYSIYFIDTFLASFKDNDFMVLNDMEKKILLYSTFMQASIFMEIQDISHSLIKILNLNINDEKLYLISFLEIIKDFNYNIYYDVFFIYPSTELLISKIKLILNNNISGKSFIDLLLS